MQFGSEHGPNGPPYSTEVAIRDVLPVRNEVLLPLVKSMYGTAYPNFLAFYVSKEGTHYYY